MAYIYMLRLVLVIYNSVHLKFYALARKLETREMKKKNGSGGGGSQSSLKPDRKTIEKKRRTDMKSLCFKLASLIPHPNFKLPKETVSQQDALGLAATYIKHLRERIEKLKKIKEEAIESMEANNSIMKTKANSVGSPVVELRDLGSSIELVLITGLNRNFMLYEVISILEQEGAEVVSASFSTVGGKIFHTLHAQAKLSRVGVETTRACQRLQELISYY